MTSFRFEEKKYTLEKKLGAGAYGEVWLAVSGQDRIAAKKIMLGSDHDDYGEEWDNGFYYTHPEDFYRETELAKKITQLNCPSLIKYLGKIKNPDGICYILMEYFEGYTLSDFIQCCEKTGYVIHPEQFLKMAKHLFQGLICIHRINILHADISMKNIMFNRREMKIIDFGLSCDTLVDWSDQTACDYEDLKARFDLESEVNEYLDVKNLAISLRKLVILGNRFVEKYNKDVRAMKILNWVNYVIDNNVTALEASNLLDKISGESEESEYIY